MKEYQHMNSQCSWHEFKPGLALIPVYGRMDGKPAQVGDTVSPVTGEFKTIQKCSKCGVSFDPNFKMRTI
jgi:hypothetical protein